MAHVARSMTLKFTITCQMLYREIRQKLWPAQISVCLTIWDPTSVLGVPAKIDECQSHEMGVVPNLETSPNESYPKAPTKRHGRHQLQGNICPCSMFDYRRKAKQFELRKCHLVCI